ncbi:MAG: SDR family oxidoreductase [Sedimenticola sp.]|uniref:SDR family oxidoreductase n=1 Tax=Sedimenticola thiotaurini TaxID=1543721 RepID=A0A558CJH9_9GAMM|nr:SDR family oxidoreductase [Sedimenticola sp.]TVT48905.1 MAG: SDR family oxidoreductase [Sedimenticola thiotaurini]
MPQQVEKSVLITGCSSGIGLSVAIGLKQRGYQVITSARKQADVERLIASGFHSVQLDLDDSDSIQQAVAEALSITSGKLYGLFNNGAYGQPGAVEDLSRQTLQAQFETNLFGWHELTCKIIPIMRQQGEGRIIQNSSVLGFAALAYRGAYNASKFALEGLTDTMRAELKGSGIQVSLIEPGPIESRFRANAYAMWKQNISPMGSFHRDAYQAMEERLTKAGPAVPFTLPPEAVLKRVIHALESPRPKIRYYVTFPTYLFGTLKRILPYRAMDWILSRV